MGFQILFRSRYDFSIFRIHNNSRLSIVFTIEVRSWLGRTIRTAEETGHGTLPLHPPQCTHWGAFHLSRGGPDGRPGVPPLRAERNSGIIRGVPLIRSSVRTGPPSPRGRLSGDRKGRPYGVSSTSTVGSVKPGAEFESHRMQFWGSQAPVGREETQAATQILRAGNTLPTPKVNPRNGGLGESSHWRTKFASAASPSVFWFLFHGEKELAPQGETLQEYNCLIKRGIPMIRYDAGQYDIAVIGAGH